MNQFNFTKAALDALPSPPEGKRSYYRDAGPKSPRGLEVCVLANGKKSFYLSRWAHGKSQRVKLGSYPEMTIEQARKKATAENAAIEAGEDPQSQRAKKRAEWTFGDLFTWYLDTHAKPRKKSVDEDEKIYKRYLGEFAKLPVSKITRTEVRQIHAGVKAGTVGTVVAKKRSKTNPGVYAANRTLSLVRAVFNYAIADEVFTLANPAQHVKPFPEESRERHLQPHEMEAFFAAVDAETNGDIRDYVLMSLFTGQRQGNVLAMRWEEVDLEAGEWRIPVTKNGQPLTVPLEAQELQLLKDRLALVPKDKKGKPTVEWVFPGRTGCESGHLTEPKRGWKRILDRAKIEDLHLHDLRRTLGSYMANSGTSLQVIGKTLGHKSHAATLIYARLSLDPVREAKRQALETMGLPKRSG